MSLDRIEKIQSIQPVQTYDPSDPQTRSNQYLLKKQTLNSVEQISSSLYATTIMSLNPSVERSSSIAATSSVNKKTKAGVLDDIGDWFKDKWDWVKDKWNTLLEKVGIKSPPSITEHRSKRAKITERHSPYDIEEDFKYIDISTTDPLKVMLAVLVRQGHLREEQTFLIQQKVLQMQDDMKVIHEERMELQAQLALVSKREGVLEKVGVSVTVAQVLTGVVTAGAVVATAATVATGGAAAPVLLVVGVLDGVLAGAQAFNTWYKGDTKEKMDKIQGEMLTRHAKREELQFQLKVDVKDMKKILTSIGGQAEIGSSILAAQYGK